MKKVGYSPPKTVVFHNNEGKFLVEVVIQSEPEVMRGHPGNKSVIMGILPNLNVGVKVCFKEFV